MSSNYLNGSRRDQSFVRHVGSVLLLFMLAGCSLGFQNESKSNILTTDPAMTAPDPAPAQVSKTIQPRAKPRPAESSMKLAAVRTDNLSLDVTYFVRLAVPKGSQLVVTLQGNGRPQVYKTTWKSGLPNRVNVPLSAGTGYPVTVDVKLISSFGHVLKGRQIVAQKSKDPVEVVVNP